MMGWDTARQLLSADPQGMAWVLGCVYLGRAACTEMPSNWTRLEVRVLWRLLVQTQLDASGGG